MVAERDMPLNVRVIEVPQIEGPVNCYQKGAGKYHAKGQTKNRD
jgi:hypothetical protein